jgi:hypothetical protein
MSEAIAIEVQPTPNINAMKFVLSRRITEGRSQTFRFRKKRRARS